MAASKFYDWKNRYGNINEHNAWIPRDHWLDDWEKTAILDFEQQYPLEGYRRLAFMMLDADVVAASPSSVYRVLKQAGRIGAFNGSPSRKGTGFAHPLAAHDHWHVDISYLNISGTFYYLASLLDGYRSRRKKDFQQVLELARVCRVERVMRPYLEASV